MKDTWTKPKAGRIKGGKWEKWGCKMETTVLAQQLNKTNNHKKVHFLLSEIN